MTASDPSGQEEPRKRSHDWGGEADRRAIIVSAETRRLENQLLAIGPMSREKLAESCGADHWRDGTFQEAVREGIRTGRIEEMPMGWLKATLGHNGRPAPPPA
jgi:hypothetical protein